MKIVVRVIKGDNSSIIFSIKVIKRGIKRRIIIVNINGNIILNPSDFNISITCGNLEESDDNNDKRKKKRARKSMMYAIFLNIMYPSNTALMPSPIMSGLSMSNLSSISSKLLSKFLYS